MTDKILWLAAYPKTGSTWLRSIVQQLVGADGKAKEAIPSLHREYPENAPVYEVLGTRSRIIRTHSHPDHSVLRTLRAERPHEVSGIITIRRHPLDVLLSQLNYSFTLGREKSFKDKRVKSVEEIISAGEIDYYIDAFIEAGGCPEYARRCKSYSGLYAAWQSFAPKSPRLDLRYEDLVKSPEEGVASVSNFLQVGPVDASAVVEKVDRLTRPNGKFFWRRRAYNYRELLPRSSISRFERGYSDGLRALGYSDGFFGFLSKLRNRSLSVRSPGK